MPDTTPRPPLYPYCAPHFPQLLKPRLLSFFPRRLVAGANNNNSSSDEGQTTDGEAESDREEESNSGGGGGGAWWGRLDDGGEVEAEVGVTGARSGTCAAAEGDNKQRAGRTEKPRRSISSSPMKLRVSENHHHEIE